MYVCGKCKETVGPGLPRLTHTVKRPDGQIAKEVPVCYGCKQQIEAEGKSSKRRQFIRKRVAL